PRQQEVHDVINALGKEKFAKRAAEFDVRAETPLANMRDLFDAGLMGLTIGKDLGGDGSGAMGTDPLLYLLAVEQAARYCLSTAHCLHIHCHGTHLVDQVGTKKQRERILGEVVAEGAMLNVTASEPGRTARGLYNLITSAEPVKGGYIVNGKKNYTTLADAVDYNILFVGIKGVPMPEGHLGLMFPKGIRGLSFEQGSWNPMGMRASYSPTVLLDNCFVEDAYVLGTPGFLPRDRWQARFHLSFAAQYVGAAEGVFDFLREYIPKRGTASDSYAQLRMGEIRVGIESARWLVYRAAALWRKDIATAELYSTLAKHRALENAVSTMDKAAQIAGSSAFWADALLARMFRDLRVQTLHENLDKSAATLGKYYLGQEYDPTARL
ncbi:MAG TPA: acyl-CoA dehydrogenase family protein, partial [Burkholderiales bacterium]|nr:acyl-CoA dehydrogenase family protein [Burkholderiales bacterium]